MSLGFCGAVGLWSLCVVGSGGVRGWAGQGRKEGRKRGRRGSVFLRLIGELFAALMLGSIFISYSLYFVAVVLSVRGDLGVYMFWKCVYSVLEESLGMER